MNTYIKYLIVLLSVFVPFCALAQGNEVEFRANGYEAETRVGADSLSISTIGLDGVLFRSSDSLTALLPAVDTLGMGEVSSLPKKVKKEMLETKVVRSSDSSMLDMKARKAYLYGNAEITYGSINLKAAYIEVDFAKSLAFAAGIADSTGKLTGTPILVEKGQEYKAITMKYNFETKRGLIHTIITQEGDGFMHGAIVKKDENDILSVANGWYTTCNLEHPHFGLRFGKAKVIPDKKIVVGPAYMVIEDAPTPIAIPFALIPNKKNQRSGILVPNIETKNEMGMGFVKGGYYWYINDYMDFKAVGDIYTRGTWAVEPEFRYKKIYQYTGNLNLGYSHIMKGVSGTPSYYNKNDYSIKWMHSQDPKAHPVNRFSANVDIKSSNYNLFHPTNTQDRLTNTYSSNINFSTSFSRFNYSVSGGYIQNTQTHEVSMTLPTMTLGMNQIYIFRKKVRQGELKWYENVNFRYNMSAGNTVRATDSTLFKGDMLSKMNYGMKHNIPISVPIKILKVLNGELSANYNEYWYGRTISHRDYIDTSFTIIGGKEQYTGYSKIDTSNGFAATRDFNFNASINTKIYGMFLIKKGAIKAFRHVLTPTVSFTYHPDFGTDFWNNYRTYIGRDGKPVRYSKYYGASHGSPPDGVSGMFNFSLNNNLEMKIRNRADTATGTKKIKLIDLFSANIGYDVAKDSLKWSPLRLNGNTTLFQCLRISCNASFDIYQINENGTAYINKINPHIFRFKDSDWNFNLNYRLNPNTFKKNKPLTPTLPNNPTTPLDRVYEPDYYIDWSTPWNFSFDYTFRYTDALKYQMIAYPYNPNDTIRESFHDRKTIQSVSFGGDINLTKKWKITLTSGYDITNKKWNYTNISLFRDLHCWEMWFRWEPIGNLKAWTFHINIKANSLKEAIKYKKEKHPWDNW